MCKVLYAMPILAPGDKNKQLASDLIVNIERMVDICNESWEPVRCCGRRTSCIGQSMQSLFHEAKQMGVVLRKSFKGDHFWIPPIPKQLQDASKVMSE